ncbi:hypothetical protein [Nocardia jiangsuensis]|uniref:LPXTG cell wall anchor domain-containing protein n=1 Tax=Nocardia jiangsuensis TaxID=1691563 RepID=A0ABV8DP54_9NOCA
MELLVILAIALIVGAVLLVRKRRGQRPGTARNTGNPGNPE